MLIHIQSDAYSPPHSIEGKFFLKMILKRLFSWSVWHDKNPPYCEATYNDNHCYYNLVHNYSQVIV